MKRHFWRLTYLQVKLGIEAESAAYNAGEALREYTKTFDFKHQSW